MKNCSARSERNTFFPCFLSRYQQLRMAPKESKSGSVVCHAGDE
jgi:hypothetical protein